MYDYSIIYLTNSLLMDIQIIFPFFTTINNDVILVHKLWHSCGPIYSTGWVITFWVTLFLILIHPHRNICKVHQFTSLLTINKVPVFPNACQHWILSIILIFKNLGFLCCFILYFSFTWSRSFQMFSWTTIPFLKIPTLYRLCNFLLNCLLHVLLDILHISNLKLGYHYN